MESLGVWLHTCQLRLVGDWTWGLAMGMPRKEEIEEDCGKVLQGGKPRGHWVGRPRNMKTRARWGNGAGDVVGPHHGREVMRVRCGPSGLGKGNLSLVL